MTNLQRHTEALRSQVSSGMVTCECNHQWFCDCSDHWFCDLRLQKITGSVTCDLSNQLIFALRPQKSMALWPTSGAMYGSVTCNCWCKWHSEILEINGSATWLPSDLWPASPAINGFVTEDDLPALWPYGHRSDYLDCTQKSCDFQIGVCEWNLEFF